MKKEERQEFILEEIRTYTKVKSSDLCKELDVSEDTVRRDLIELAEQGLIKKVHGGATSRKFIPYSHKEREIYAHEEKVVIVRKARKLLRDNLVIAMDGGTTNLEMARLFPQDLSVSVITNSLPIAIQLTDHPQIETIFFGGKIHKSAQVAIGFDVIRSLNEVKSDLCFIGTRSLDPLAGMTDIDREEAQVKQALIQNSKRAVCLTLSEKLNTVQPYQICPINAIDYIVTELDTDDELLIPYREKGINLI